MLPFLLAATLVAAIAAATDFRTGRIPNWLTAGGIVAGLVGHTAVGWLDGGWRAALTHGGLAVVGAVFCAIAPVIMFWRGAMGGGDVKLYAAIGALCHPMLGIEAQMYSLIAAAILAPARMAYEGKLFRALGGALRVLLNPFRPRAKRTVVPAEAMTWFRLGPAIFLGTVMTLVAHAYVLMPPTAAP